MARNYARRAYATGSLRSCPCLRATLAYALGRYAPCRAARYAYGAKSRSPQWPSATPFGGRCAGGQAAYVAPWRCLVTPLPTRCACGTSPLPRGCAPHCVMPPTRYARKWAPSLAAPLPRLCLDRQGCRPAPGLRDSGLRCAAPRITSPTPIDAAPNSPAARSGGPCSRGGSCLADGRDILMV